MDPLARILAQAAIWLRRPPSRTQALVMLGALVAALVVVAVERWVGWPDWARAERGAVLRAQP